MATLSEHTATVVVAGDGPYLVSGAVPLSTATIATDAEGGSEHWTQSAPLPAPASYALCRCGHSHKKPFCDGTHAKVGFVGTETASRMSYRDQAKVYEGPGMELHDSEALCAFARFCDPHGKVWSEITATDQSCVRGNFIRQVGNCPSGRLVARDTLRGETLEPALPVSIGLIEDPAQDCAGPLWLRGGIAVIAADGYRYEVRNRVTLCRCGQSSNKPFCDGTHASVKFQGT